MKYSQKNAFFNISMIVLMLFGCFLISPSFLSAKGKGSIERLIEKERRQQRVLVLKAFSKTTLRSVEISLQEMKKSELATWISKQALPVELEGETLKEISEALRAQILLRLKTSIFSSDIEALNNAFKRSMAFLRLDDRCLEDFSKSPDRVDAKCQTISLKKNVENLNSMVWAVKWQGIQDYVESRLGPLKELINTLNAHDQVILTNSPFDIVSAEISDAMFEVRYNLPLSSYGKDIRMIFRKGGKKSLVLAAFDSKAYLLHFGLLISWFRHDTGLQFEILDAIDSESLVKSYQQLLEFASCNSSTFSSFDALVIGYASEFSEKWEKYQIKNLEQKGYPGENWKISVFRFPEGKTVGVLGGDVDFYGENLVCQLEQLIASFPVPLVFFGGSGGALIPRPPYDLYFPSTIRSNDGNEVQNVLSGSVDAGSHISVDSPLLETPHSLARFQMQHFNTIDMEGGHLARLATRYGTKIGVGILVTDFPVGFSSIDVSLGKQNFGAKKFARNNFVEQVESYVRSDKKTFLHKIENVSGMPVHEISRINLERLRNEIGILSRDEQELVARLLSFPLRISVRMTPGRLYWTLRDGALFSTGLVNSLGSKTSPYTPNIEDEMFGAFDYVFAEYSPNFGRRIYGDVIVLLKPERILPRTWGTRISGWRVSSYTPGGSMQQHQANFISEVFHSDHFSEAIGLHAVNRFRKLSPDEQKKLMSSSIRSMAENNFDLGLGYLELKIKSYVMRFEIDRVMLPPEARGEIPVMLKTQGIPYEYYNPRRYSE